MLFRLVRPVRRSGTTMSQFVQRIPKDVRGRAVGKSLSIPIGSETVHLTISPQAEAVRFSWRTGDPSETKKRQAETAAHLETVWQALREDGPIPLNHREATALSGRLYRAWASGVGRERTVSVTLDRESGDALRVTKHDILRFKGNRLATVNPRTGRTISAKTVKDSDLASLKTIFGWAASNDRMTENIARESQVSSLL